jgi:uncharacterized protein (DUF1501 family)
MTNRRELLKMLSATGAVGLGSGLSMLSLNSSSASSAAYKALVVIHLNGGNDGNDLLVPIDAAYTDYQKSRPSIALRKDDLVNLSSQFFGHTMGLNRAMSSLVPLFNQRKLGFIANAGPLIKPTTASEVLNGTASLPPFLYSHPEQTHLVLGWMGDQDPSGWGGRAIEAMSGNRPMKAPLISIDSGASTLVLGQRSRILNAESNFSTNLGHANLADKNSEWTQIMESLTRLQSSTHVESEYARTFRANFLDSVELVKAESTTTNPAGNFENNDLARRLRFAARVMPFYKAAGASSQIYAVEWGQFDTHSNQRNSNDQSGRMNQDSQLAQLANALVAFDQAINAAGLGDQVAVLVTSEFGRTLDPAAGNGSDHAWGSHWMVMGGQVNGAKMYGDKFPSLVLGGVDDAHDGKRGYWVPQMSSDQVAADLLLWLGLPQDKLTEVMPNLKNFAKKGVGFMNG